MAKRFILASAAVASLLLVQHDTTHFSSVSWTFAGLSVLLFTGLFVYKAIVYPYMLSPIRHIPAPKGDHWLFGHFFEIHRSAIGTPQLKWMEELPDNSGLIRYRESFDLERVMPCSPKTLSEVLHQKSYSFVKPDFMRNSFGRILGLRGLLFSEGDEHRHQRKLLLPAFSHLHIKSLVPTFWDISCELTEKISGFVSASAETPVIEMSRWCSLATLDIIGRAGFGYEFNALSTASVNDASSESGSELARACNTIFAPIGIPVIMQLAFVTLPIWLLGRLPLQRNKDVQQALGAIKRISVEIINTKKRELAEKQPTTKYQDILSVMLKSGEYDGPDGVDVMRDQMMTFLVAGHETTATAMIWALHVLSLKENIHIQNKLRDEIRKAFPHGIPETVSYEQIESLKYLRKVTLEVFRLFPPVPLTGRSASEDTTLGGQFIPKGTRIVFIPAAINKSKKLWGEDADQFRPERWDERQSESNYAFLTFLAGPRGCIGKIFAKMEYKCLLVAFIGRLSFEQAEEGREIVIKTGITSKPVGGIPLKVSVVQGW